MPLQHQDIWMLLGVERAKFRKIRPFAPGRSRRKYSARDVFAFKILMTLVNDHVPAMKPMEKVFMEPLFERINDMKPFDIKRSLVLWHTTEDYIKVVNEKEPYDKDDYRLKSLPLKRLYKDYLQQLDQIDDSFNNNKTEENDIRPEFKVISGRK